MADKEKALLAKNEGNQAFLKHDWPAAIELYTRAIDLDGSEPTYFANRAQVRLEVELCAMFVSCAAKTQMLCRRHI